VAEPILPLVDATNAAFWHSGADGQLRFQHCHECGWWIHPPKPRCPKCLSVDTAFDPVSGKAMVWSYTINHQRWSPDLEVPYALAIVEFPEQFGLRMTTRLVDIAVDDVTIGLPVHVRFEPVADLYLPLFAPDR
jgi:uncharacterized protein